jgi:transketolase
VHVPGHPDEAEAQLRAAVTADGPVYLRLSVPANAAPFPVRPGELAVLRTGNAGTVLTIGPMADAVLAATAGLDVTVLYAATIRPFDAHTLRATLSNPNVVLVEPYLTGTSVPFVAEALRDIPHRVLARHRPSDADQHDCAHDLAMFAGRRTQLPAQLQSDNRHNEAHEPEQGYCQDDRVAYRPECESHREVVQA